MNKDNFSILLPDTIDQVSLVDPINPTIYLEASVGRVRLKVGKIKYAIEDVLKDIWQAHELLVRTIVPGWSWGRYCKEIGINRKTPLNWFQKYGLKYTISRRPLTEENSSVKTPEHHKLTGINPTEVIIDEGPNPLDSIPVVRPVERSVTEVDIEQAVEGKTLTVEALKRIKKNLNKALTPEIVSGIKKKIEKAPEDEEKSQEDKWTESLQNCNENFLNIRKVMKDVRDTDLPLVVVRSLELSKSLLDNFDYKFLTPGSDIIPRLEKVAGEIINKLKLLKESSNG